MYLLLYFKYLYVLEQMNSRNYYINEAKPVSCNLSEEHTEHIFIVYKKTQDREKGR